MNTHTYIHIHMYVYIYLYLGVYVNMYNIHTHVCFSPFVSLTCKSHGKNAKAVPLREELHLLQILKVEVVARHWGMQESWAQAAFPCWESLASLYPLCALKSLSPKQFNLGIPEPQSSVCRIPWTNWCFPIVFLIRPL